mmetsp:Transcript_33096/g.47855  ORF Transcript_33096/g.47855 Transcript_33096/m.47855 type:complete len:460 (-) Transcript_33096:881-2260(-)
MNISGTQNYRHRTKSKSAFIRRKSVKSSFCSSRPSLFVLFSVISISFGGFFVLYTYLSRDLERKSFTIKDNQHNIIRPISIYVDEIVILILNWFVSVYNIIVPKNDFVERSYPSNLEVKDIYSHEIIHQMDSTIAPVLEDCKNCAVGELSFLTVDNVRYVLSRHPFKSSEFQALLRNGSVSTMVDYIEYLYRQPACRWPSDGKQLPVFISMANVYSDLYWQLIENFIYSMVKFGLSSCAMMVCVSDSSCMALCQQAGFPCYDFQYSQYHPGQPLPSVLEQIGELKLLHLPKALKLGVDILMLDLDVGFMDNPLKLLDLALNDSSVDVLVQKDISFVMHRDVVRWRTWFLVPLPNIGIFYCRGNDKTVAMFELAWQDYKTVDSSVKENPGKDQNKVVSAMQEARCYPSSPCCFSHALSQLLLRLQVALHPRAPGRAAGQDLQVREQDLRAGRRGGAGGDE